MSALDAAAFRNPAISYHMGMIQLALGNSAAARSYLNFAAQSPQPFPGDRDAKTEWKKLNP